MKSVDWIERTQLNAMGPKVNTRQSHLTNRVLPNQQAEGSYRKRHLPTATTPSTISLQLIVSTSQSTTANKHSRDSERHLRAATGTQTRNPKPKTQRPTLNSKTVIEKQLIVTRVGEACVTNVLCGMLVKRLLANTISAGDMKANSQFQYETWRWIIRIDWYYLNRCDVAQLTAAVLLPTLLLLISAAHNL